MNNTFNSNYGILSNGLMIYGGLNVLIKFNKFHNNGVYFENLTYNLPSTILSEYSDMIIYEPSKYYISESSPLMIYSISILNISNNYF